MGIHYDYKSKRGERAMLKEAKRKARLAERRAKRLSSTDTDVVQKDEVKTHDISKIITLEELNSKQELRQQRIEKALRSNLKKRKIFQNKINKKAKK